MTYHHHEDVGNFHFVDSLDLSVDLMVGRGTSDGTHIYIFEDSVDLETASVDSDESSCFGVRDA